MAGERPPGIRLLRERQPDGRSPPMEPGTRTSSRRVPAAQDADVQRLRRPGRQPVHGHGPSSELLKPIVLLRRVAFVLALVPAALLVYDAFTGQLTANPVDYIEDQTGDWTIIFLMISLGVTPLRRLSRWNEIIKL